MDVFLRESAGVSQYYRSLSEQEKAKNILIEIHPVGGIHGHRAMGMQNLGEKKLG